jgi:hypothetical protein
VTTIRAITRLGLAGSGLGTIAGLVELTIGSGIREWIGNKQDPTRLGLVTIALSLITAATTVALRRQRLSPSQQAAAAAGLLGPGLICFSTVGRLWYVPGILLVAAGLLVLADLRGHTAAVRQATAHNWTAILTGTLGLLYLALGLTAHGLPGLLGIAGGLAILTLVASRLHLLRFRRTALAGAVLPFAIVTWWSVVTPLIALLVIAIGGPPGGTSTADRQGSPAQAGVGHPIR